jgi:uncharacterized protein (UPF0335 family)
MPSNPNVSATPSVLDQAMQGDAFGQFDQHPAQPQTPSTTVASAAPSSGVLDQAMAAHEGDAFDQVDAHEKAQTEAQAAAAKDQVARHGILRRAWDWVNQPILDNVLPKDIKTADVIKAAAFEKLYNEAYIPGVNDFETKAQEHLGDSPTKQGLRTFINGVASDTSNIAAGVTSPVGIATALATAGTGEGLGATIPAVTKVARPLIGTAFALKGAHDIYKAGTENTPQAWQQRLLGAAMVAGGATGAKGTAGDGIAAARELPSAVSDDVNSVKNAVANKVSTAKNFATGGQTKLQPAIRNAAQRAADIGAARPAIELTEAAHPNVPAEYQDLINEAMKQGPSWTPAKAKPIAHALGDDFEVRGSVGEGKPSYNDLDIWAKSGDLSDAAPKLEQLGFKKVADTAHGETWTNETTAQNVDLWDSEHEPIKGHGPDTEETEGTDENEDEQKLIGKTVAGAPAAKVSPTVSMRTALQNVSEDIEGRGKQIYRALDKATDNKFTTYTDRLTKINDRLADLIPDTTESDNSAIERLEQQKSEIETSQAQMFEDLKNSGIDPQLVDDAKAYWRQSMALRDVDQALKTSTKGNVGYGAKELVDSSKLVTRLEKLNVSRNGQASRLVQALGKDGADALMKDAYEAVNTKQNLKYVKWGTGIAAGLGLLNGSLHNLASWAGALLP